MFVAALVAAPGSSALSSLTYIPASPANYLRAHRPKSMVRLVVVHVVEGTYWGAIAWFRNPRAHASANYVVARDGAVAEMVPPWDVAWHAGNGWVNWHSLGVENEGYTHIPWTFTDAEYRASSRLVASLLRHYVLPIDRRHVIGHAEVRDPVRPWLSGGSSHHTDPGPYWDWPRFMSYVRSFARGRTPPPPALDVTTNLRLLQRLTGTVRWEGLVSGLPVARVQFLVDGRLRETVGHPPYAFSNGAWNTTWERNGRHVVTVHAVAADGRSADASSVVTIKNQPPRVSGINLADGQTVSGLVRVEATVSRPPQRVELLVDGAVRGSSTTPPYGFDWDTTQEVPGVRMLTVRAVVRGYAVSALSVFVVVVPPAP